MSSTTSSHAPQPPADSAHTFDSHVEAVHKIPQPTDGVEMAAIGSFEPAASNAHSHASDAPASAHASQRAGNPDAPNLTIAYHNVSASVQISPSDSLVKTIFTPVVKISQILTGSAATSTFHRVHEASGIICPGTMTLIMAPPGHGKSSLLRMLADRLKPDHNDANDGGRGADSAVKDVGVRYNGLTNAQAAAEGCSVRRLCHLVEQVDEHLPLLTVRETLEFAHECTSMVRDPMRVDSVIHMLGLEECQNTILGDALTRGVSGGQKRRVTVGEMLVGDARAVFLDEYTNGLDSATAEDITRGLRKWARETNGSVVTTAQQPTPGLFASYDDVIIMNNADVIYHGPREDVVPFFASMGFNCPDDVDVCDFIIDCVSQPRVALQRLQHNERSAAKAAKAAGAPVPNYSTARQSISSGTLSLAPTPCVTAAQMLAHYHASPFYLRILAGLKPYFADVEVPTLAPTPVPEAAVVEPLLPSALAKRVYSTTYVQSLRTLFAMVFAREARVLLRSRLLVIPRLLQDLVFGLIFGSYFYMVPADGNFLRVATLLTLISQCCLGNMSDLPKSVSDSRIVFRQSAAGMYPAWAYAITAAVIAVPILIVECIIMGVLVYFMSDCFYEAGAFFTFFAILFVTNFLASVFYRLVSAGAADEPAAHSIAGPVTCLCMVLGSFYVTMNSMPIWMQWLMWISPFSWSVRAMANNEFLSSRYDALADNGQRIGHVYLDALDLKIGYAWIGYAVLYLMGLSFLLLVVHSWVLRQPFFESSIGTRRVDEAEVLETEEEKAAEEAIQAHDAEVEDDVANGLASHPSFSVGEVSRLSAATDASAADSKVLKTLREALPFAPMWLSFSDIHYTVKVAAADGTLIDRPLLRGVNGYAEPGKLTALMGASGAGKTTLLDVLAGRKNTGAVEGKILFNGRTPTPADVAYHTGYVEQFDSLFPYDTVYETLLFAARLRLPASVGEETKAAIVDEILDILELTPIRDYIIGNARVVGLSPSQLKRVNIGCELVANPAILFLDEPTTGLDSRAAQTVVRVVRRIARSGRSVICTIHQPSAELFYLFDRLVLLASGGHQLFFGSLGVRCKHFIPFIEATEGVSKCPPRYNPASWMLEEMGVGQASAVPSGPDGARPGRYDDVKVITERFKKTWLASRQHRATTDLLHRLEAIGNETDAAAAGVDAAAKPAELEPEFEMAGVLSAAPAPPVIFGGDLHSVAIHKAGAAPSRQHSYASAAQNSIVAAMPTAGAAVPKREPPSLFYAYLCVQARSTVGYFRNPPVMFVRTAVIVCLSVILGLIYFDLKPHVQAQAISYVGLIGISTILGALYHGGSAQPSMLSNRAVMYRELASSMYPAWLWSLAGFVSEAFYSIFTTFIVQIPTYFLVGLNDDAAIFWRHYFITYLLVMCYAAMAGLLSSAAPDNTVSGMYQTVWFGLCNAFSGVSLPIDSTPRGWRWFVDMLPVQKVTRTLVLNQARTCSPLPLCGPMIEVVQGTKTHSVYLLEFFESYFGYNVDDSYGHTVGWLILFIVVVQALAFIAISTLNWSKR